MRDLRIVFMGTPGFAVGVLKKLIETNKNIVGIITSPDRPAGRGRKLKESDVKKFAKDLDIPILQPTNLKDPEFLKQLKELNANVQVIVAFRMLPKEVWQMPIYGTFNLHASLLPQYRGAAPINWAIINRESKTGVTTFFIDDKIDTGEIIDKKEVEISNRETVGSLHDTLMHTGADLVVDTINLIETNKIISTKQNESLELKDAPKLTKENTKINWQWDGNKIDAFIRGLNPYPAAWSTLYNNEELKVKFYDVNFKNENHNYEFGSVFTSKKEMKIAVKGGYLFIDNLQLPGKRKMDIVSLLNGFSFNENSKMM